MFVNGGEIRFSIFHASSSTSVYPNELHRDLGQKKNEGGFPSCVKGQGYEFEFKNFPKAHDLKNVQKSNLNFSLQVFESLYIKTFELSLFHLASFFQFLFHFSLNIF